MSCFNWTALAMRFFFSSISNTSLSLCVVGVY
jgi:hypothetical protein